MNFFYKDITITGLLVVIPENERDFVDDMKMFNFPESRSLKLKEVMGYDKHRIVKDKICVSDLAVFGLKHLFNRGSLIKDDFDSLLVVTQSPDHFIPGTSSVIQGELGLKTDLLCMDITQGCAGYLVGLMQAFMLLQQPSINKVDNMLKEFVEHAFLPDGKHNKKAAYPAYKDDCKYCPFKKRGDLCPPHKRILKPVI